MRIILIVALLFASCYISAQNVGIGTRDPLYTLHTQGHLVVQAPYRTSQGNPVSNITMMNGGSPTVSDSVFRFYDPGGPSGNYISGLSAQLNVVPGAGSPIGIQLEIEALNLGTGDTVKVISSVAPGATLLVITQQNQVGQRFLVNSNATTIIRFTSNVDGSEGAGFSMLVRKVFFASSARRLQTGQLIGYTMAFDVSSGSLFAGQVAENGTTVNLGDESINLGSDNETSRFHSYALGDGNRASNVETLAVGASNTAEGNRSAAIGVENKSSGSYSYTFGYNNNAKSEYGMALGLDNDMPNDNQFLFGSNLIGKAPTSLYLGFSNDTLSLNPTLPNQIFPATEPLLVIGNGVEGNPSNALVMHKDGNTGIGINRPQARLHVRDKVVIEQPGTTGLASFEWRSNNTYRGGFGYDAGAGRFFFFDGESGTNTFFVNNGRFGIQRDATTNALEVNGNASKSSAGDWLANSDARLKKDILPLQSPLEKIQQLQGVTFAWNDTKTGIDRPAGSQMGFTAQNVQQVFPELVSTDAQGYLQTSYGTYDALYVEAIKALHEQNKQLQQQVEQLQQQIHALQQKIK